MTTHLLDFLAAVAAAVAWGLVVFLAGSFL